MQPKWSQKLKSYNQPFSSPKQKNFRKEKQGWLSLPKKNKNSVETKNGGNSRKPENFSGSKLKSFKKRNFLPGNRFKKLLKLGYRSRDLKLRELDPILTNYVAGKYASSRKYKGKSWRSESKRFARGTRVNVSRGKTDQWFKSQKEMKEGSQNKSQSESVRNKESGKSRDSSLIRERLLGSKKRREISSLTEAKKQTAELRRIRRLKRAKSGDDIPHLAQSPTPKSKVSYIKKNKQSIKGVDFLSHRIGKLESKENLAGLINRTMQLRSGIPAKKKKSIERRSKLKLFNYENAVVVKDNETGKSIVIYKTGEVYFGEMDSANMADGVGIFFFPYCGFVYGRFEAGRLEGDGVMKDPDASFGFFQYEEGIVQDMGLCFGLNWKKYMQRKEKENRETVATKSNRKTEPFPHQNNISTKKTKWTKLSSKESQDKIKIDQNSQTLPKFKNEIASDQISFEESCQDENGKDYFPNQKSRPNVNIRNYVPFKESCLDLILKEFEDGVEKEDRWPILGENERGGYVCEIIGEMVGKNRCLESLNGEIGKMSEEFGLKISFLCGEEGKVEFDRDEFGDFEDPYVGKLRTKRYLYFGCIKNKKPHGIGIQFCHDKSISSGNFKNGKLDGFGKKIFGPGHVFIGKFFNGQMDEKGYFYDQNSSKWYIFNQDNRLNIPLSDKKGPTFPEIYIDVSRIDLEHKEVFLRQRKHFRDDFVLFDATQAVKIVQKYQNFGRNFSDFSFAKQIRQERVKYSQYLDLKSENSLFTMNEDFKSEVRTSGVVSQSRTQNFGGLKISGMNWVENYFFPLGVSKIFQNAKIAKLTENPLKKLEKTEDSQYKIKPYKNPQMKTTISNSDRIDSLTPSNLSIPSSYAPSRSKNFFSNQKEDFSISGKKIRKFASIQDNGGGQIGNVGFEQNSGQYENMRESGQFESAEKKLDDENANLGNFDGRKQKAKSDLILDLKDYYGLKKGSLDEFNYDSSSEGREIWDRKVHLDTNESGYGVEKSRNKDEFDNIANHFNEIKNLNSHSFLNPISDEEDDQNIPSQNQNIAPNQKNNHIIQDKANVTPHFSANSKDYSQKRNNETGNFQNNRPHLQNYPVKSHTLTFGKQNLGRNYNYPDNTPFKEPRTTPKSFGKHLNSDEKEIDKVNYFEQGVQNKNFNPQNLEKNNHSKNENEFDKNKQNSEQINNFQKFKMRNQRINFHHPSPLRLNNKKKDVKEPMSFKKRDLNTQSPSSTEEFYTTDSQLKKIYNSYFQQGQKPQKPEQLFISGNENSEALSHPNKQSNLEFLHKKIENLGEENYFYLSENVFSQNGGKALTIVYDQEIKPFETQEQDEVRQPSEIGQNFITTQEENLQGGLAVDAGLVKNLSEVAWQDHEVKIDHGEVNQIENRHHLPISLKHGYKFSDELGSEKLTDIVSDTQGSSNQPNSKKSEQHTSSNGSGGAANPIIFPGGNIRVRYRHQSVDSRRETLGSGRYVATPPNNTPAADSEMSFPGSNHRQTEPQYEEKLETNIRPQFQPNLSNSTETNYFYHYSEKNQNLASEKRKIGNKVEMKNEESGRDQIAKNLDGFSLDRYEPLSSDLSTVTREKKTSDNRTPSGVEISPIREENLPISQDEIHDNQSNRIIDRSSSRKIIKSEKVIPCYKNESQKKNESQRRKTLNSGEKKIWDGNNIYQDQKDKNNLFSEKNMFKDLATTQKESISVKPQNHGAQWTKIQPITASLNPNSSSPDLHSEKSKVVFSFGINDTDEKNQSLSNLKNDSERSELDDIPECPRNRVSADCSDLPNQLIPLKASHFESSKADTGNLFKESGSNHEDLEANTGRKYTDFSSSYRTEPVSLKTNGEDYSGLKILGGISNPETPVETDGENESREKIDQDQIQKDNQLENNLVDKPLIYNKNCEETEKNEIKDINKNECLDFQDESQNIQKIEANLESGQIKISDSKLKAISSKKIKIEFEKPPAINNLNQNNLISEKITIEEKVPLKNFEKEDLGIEKADPTSIPLEIYESGTYFRESVKPAPKSRVVFKIWKRYNFDNIEKANIKIRHKGKSLNELESPYYHTSSKSQSNDREIENSDQQNNFINNKNNINNNYNDNLTSQTKITEQNSHIVSNKLSTHRSKLAPRLPYSFTRNKPYPLSSKNSSIPGNFTPRKRYQVEKWNCNNRVTPLNSDRTFLKKSRPDLTDQNFTSRFKTRESTEFFEDPRFNKNLRPNAIKDSASKNKNNISSQSSKKKSFPDFRRKRPKTKISINIPERELINLVKNDSVSNAHSTKSSNFLINSGVLLNTAQLLLKNGIQIKTSFRNGEESSDKQS